MKIEYSSNNSGGYWWLDDEQWRKLEAAGWHVVWGGLYFCESKSGYRSAFSDPRDAGLPELCGPEVEQGKCHGHRRAQNATDAEKVRWLGALAREAHKDFPSLADAIREFEAAVAAVVARIDARDRLSYAPSPFTEKACGGPLRVRQ